jgi:hypothetical protein
VVNVLLVRVDATAQAHKAATRGRIYKPLFLQKFISAEILFLTINWQ